MVIDMHTHIFPDRIAADTVRTLASAGGSPAYTDGTCKGLESSMREAGITASVVLPVVTKPAQFASVNRFAAAINQQYETEQDCRIVSFGGIHPAAENYKEQLREICNLGLKGIKLHPDYQKTFIDDISYLRLIDYASELGLSVTIHAGLDVGLPDPVHCTPERTAHLLEIIQPERLILAHMGGYARWDEVEEHLVGRNVYMDLGYVMGHMEEQQLVRMVRNHGADRIFFATDSPWGGQKQDLERFRKIGFTTEESRLMLYQNALRMGIVDLQE